MEEVLADDLLVRLGEALMDSVLEVVLEIVEIDEVQLVNACTGEDVILHMEVW